jgi:hypothetical protein
MTLVKKTLSPKGVGRYEEKTATVQDGSGLPYMEFEKKALFSLFFSHFKGLDSFSISPCYRLLGGLFYSKIRTKYN